jgi:hypothetical protein
MPPPGGAAPLPGNPSPDQATSAASWLLVARWDPGEPCARRDVPERKHQRSLVDLEKHEIGMIEILVESLDAGQRPPR